MRPVPVSMQGACRLDDWLVHISSDGALMWLVPESLQTRERGSAPSIGRHGRCCSDEEKLLLSPTPTRGIGAPSSSARMQQQQEDHGRAYHQSHHAWRSSISSPMLTQSRSPLMLSSTLHEVRFALGCSRSSAVWSSIA
nr:uncharacterized protein LOC109750485 [Aegilops tauschii subsp. strangulata]